MPGSKHIAPATPATPVLSLKPAASLVESVLQGTPPLVTPKGYPIMSAVSKKVKKYDMCTHYYTPIPSLPIICYLFYFFLGKDWENLANPYNNLLVWFLEYICGPTFKINTVQINISYSLHYYISNVYHLLFLQLIVSF